MHSVFDPVVRNRKRASRHISDTGRVDPDELEQKSDSWCKRRLFRSCFARVRRQTSLIQVVQQLDSMKSASEEEHVVQIVVENHLQNLRN